MSTPAALRIIADDLGTAERDDWPEVIDKAMRDLRKIADIEQEPIMPDRVMIEQTRTYEVRGTRDLEVARHRFILVMDARDHAQQGDGEAGVYCLDVETRFLP